MLPSTLFAIQEAAKWQEMHAKEENSLTNCGGAVQKKNRRNVRKEEERKKCSLYRCLPEPNQFTVPHITNTHIHRGRRRWGLGSVSSRKWFPSTEG